MIESPESPQEQADPLEAKRLLARGVELRLSDGLHRVIFDYEALEFIEDAFEGIDNFMAALNETRLKQKRLRNIRLGLTAALLHEKPEGQSEKEFGAELRSKMMPRDLVDYLDALTSAIMEAFPPPTKADEDPKAKGSRGASPGNGSTTSQRSRTGARMHNSGG